MNEELVLEVSGTKISNCYCDGALWDSSVLIYLSLFGSTNSVKTIWARLREKYAGVELGTNPLILHDGFRYLKIQAPLKTPGTSHLVLIEEKCTSQLGMNASEFYQIGEDSDEKFFERLDRNCAFPFRKSWKKDLWTKGLEKGTILPLDGFGLQGFCVSTQTEDWSKIVLDGLEDGTFS